MLYVLFYHRFSRFEIVLCTFIEENSLRRVIKIETQPLEVVCPCCGRKTKRTGKRLNMYQAYSEVV